MRSIICVVAGLVVVMAVFVAGTAAATELIVPGGLFGAATGPIEAIPATFFAGSLVMLAMGTVLGGWVTARMAPSREMVHVAALAALILVMALGTLRAESGEPIWYVYALPFFGISGALLGGWLRSRVVVKA